MESLLDKEGALELVAGDAELYKTLLETYLQEDQFDRTYVEGLLKNGEGLAVSQYIHRIKGASRQIGAKKLGIAAQTLEDICKGKITGNVNDALEEFSLLYSATVQEVKNALL